jgi:hypothetical protein
LAPGKSCKVSVTFNPTDTTAQSGESHLTAHATEAASQTARRFAFDD